MTSKTFKNAHTVHGSMTVREEAGCVSVSVNMDSPSDTIIHLAPSDAPALALAILEAAGVEPDREPLECQVSLGTIVADLQETIQYAEALASAHREQAELEAEALELYNTLQVEIHGIPGPDWVNATEFLSDETKRKWLAVARRAREMRAEK